ncbi:hypothetical protein Aab01nite_28600 [Paractinoplanes abujensis]|uniref:Diguanylate cyclase (GGDEF)-like protein n=1 Tax=Paractinoplanes abujensis TaxID=882441 RepID=A0A7W7G752_9ACTN|nr:GGDEF domain-containing protein [Actinoplanes abujensis]MBB4698244.1 diguanylate cyclase (GGDEF)-like protein [Actinoplanes abujensis]GID19270.1 hypothetical protein Aab01nite_28600 [Actinoplanes abujensis]
MLRGTNLVVVAGLAVTAAWSVLHRTWSGAAQAAVVIAVLLMVVRVLARRDADLRALRRAVARERVLGELGAALITATTRADVHRLAVEAAGALLADIPGARAAVAAPGCTDLGAATDRHGTQLSLTAGGRFFGTLAVSADADLPAEVFPALQALRGQVAPALAGVALTAELSDQALSDPLTGLGNRAMLRERLGAALARARRSGRPAGVLLLDLNGFKQVNDRYGHHVGDELLQAVAARLHECVRAEDVVGRLGGDEFVVITEDLTSARDAVVVAERIVASLDAVIPIGPHRLRTPASVGIALSHSEVTGPDELLRLADAAMYRAKRRGGGGHHLHGVPEAEPALT